VCNRIKFWDTQLNTGHQIYCFALTARACRACSPNPGAGVWACICGAASLGRVAESDCSPCRAQTFHHSWSGWCDAGSPVALAWSWLPHSTDWVWHCDVSYAML